MDHDAFWNLIRRTKEDSSGDPHKQAELLVEALVNLSEQDILDYARICEQYQDRAYAADPWAAAGIIDSWGCAEDDFIDFRAWLIAQGKTVYEKALADPESLADVVEAGMETQIEELLYVAYLAYERKTGREEMPRRIGYIPPTLMGQFPPNQASYKERFPRLAAKFGVRPD